MMMGGWGLGYNVSPVPSFPPYTGPYSVGTVDVEIPSADLLSPSASSSAKEEIPSTVAFRVFYPCEAPTKPSRPVYWVPQPQKETLEAFYSKFLKASQTLSIIFRWLSHLLYYTSIPAIRNAPLLNPPHEESKRWPVLIFSHGLAGSRNSYSHLCGSLASHGIIVLALDHRDGSSPIQYIRATSEVEAHVVDYLQLPHDPTSLVFEGRDKQLRIRIAEISLLFEALLRIDRGQEVSNLDANDDSVKKTKDGKSSSEGLLSMFRDRLDMHRPGSVTFAGHSLGGATAVQTVKSVYYSYFDTPLLVLQLSTELKAQITPSTPIILFDPWGLPLVSPNSQAICSRPLPCFIPDGPGGASVLTIMSEAFNKWKGNMDQVFAALRDPEYRYDSEKSQRPQSHIFYPLRSAHLSQSDYGILLPNLCKFLSKADEPVRTMRLNVRAALEVMRRAGIPVADTAPADMEEGEAQDEEKAPSAHEKGDWRILSTTEGSVRGWVRLSANEEERAVNDEIANRAEAHAQASDEAEGKTQNRDSSEDEQEEKIMPQPVKQQRKRMRMLLRRMSSRAEHEMVGIPGAHAELIGGPEMEESAMMDDAGRGVQGLEVDDMGAKSGTTAVQA